MTTTIRLRGPADIITVLPYHLGYRPADSLVVVLLTGPRIGVVARIDLPPPEVDPQLLVDELLPVVVREQADRAVLVGYESRPGHAAAATTALLGALVEAGIRPVERLLVRDGRWWCLDDDCSPPEGLLVPPDEAVPAVSEYVVLGRHPAATRSGLGDRLAGDGDPVQDARCAVLIQDLEEARRSPRPLQRRRQRGLQAWGQVLGATDALLPAPHEEVWARCVVALLDVPVRDLLIAWLCPGTLELEVFPVALRRLAATALPPPHGEGLGGELDEGRGRLLERLTLVCRRSPPELSPGPLTMLGHVAWWLGDGALARTAVERALEVDPGYRLAVLLERMVDVAVRPRRIA